MKSNDEHERIYFQNPRPIFELYDLENDPFELNNLAGQTSVRIVEAGLREKLDRWMLRESDFLPLPTHAHQNIEPQSKAKKSKMKQFITNRKCI